MKTEAEARRPELTIEYKESKEIHLVDMACLTENNVLEKN